MMKRLQRIVFPMFLLLFVYACGNDNDVIPETAKLTKDYDSQVVQQWQSMLMDVERYATLYRPCRIFFLFPESQ